MEKLFEKQEDTVEISKNYLLALIIIRVQIKNHYRYAELVNMHITYKFIRGAQEQME